MIFTTQRLILREMTEEDLPALKEILQDNLTMKAYEGAFSNEEVEEWLKNQQARYEKYHFDLWGVVLKETVTMIGQCGLTIQPWKNEKVLEVGYLFNRKFWHQGYATEAAKGCKKYAFETLQASEVCSIIRETNIASQKVALRNGMKEKDTWVKYYKGVHMPHLRFIVEK